jgi:hypothetical protein
MALAGLQGPFTLNKDALRIKVTAKFPGTFVLGHTDEQGTFIVECLGRSNDDVKQTLQDHLVDGHEQFAFEYYFSARGAFEKESDLYHDHMAAGDTPHPGRRVRTGSARSVLFWTS